jgi:hypothetical protein
LPGVIGGACAEGYGQFRFSLLRASPGDGLTFNTGLNTWTLLDAGDVFGTLVEATEILCNRVNTEPAFAGLLEATYTVNGVFTTVTVRYPLGAASEALLPGSNACGLGNFAELAWTGVSPGMAAPIVTLPLPGDQYNANCVYECCPIPCAPEGLENYGEFKLRFWYGPEAPYTLQLYAQGEPCEDQASPASGVVSPSEIQNWVDATQLVNPTWIFEIRSGGTVSIWVPIPEIDDVCGAEIYACCTGNVWADIIQLPTCCQPVDPCVPGVDYLPEESSSPVFTEGIGDVFDAVAVFYADCCSPVDGVVVLTNEAPGVTLVGLPVVTPLGGNQYSVAQSVEYDGTPIAGTPGEQIDGGTLTFTVACGGADDTAIQIAAIIAEPEDPIPTCPIVIQAANSNRIERVEFSPSGLFSLQARLGMPGCCALPVVSAVVTYEDIPSRLTVLAGGVSNVMVPGSQFFTFQNFQFDTSVATAVPGPYPKLVATAVITYACGDSTITRTVNFYLLDPV